MKIYVVIGKTDYSPTDVMCAFAQRADAEAFLAPRKAWVDRRPSCWSHDDQAARKVWKAWVDAAPDKCMYDDYAIVETELNGDIVMEHDLDRVLKVESFLIELMLRDEPWSSRVQADRLLDILDGKEKGSTAPWRPFGILRNIKGKNGDI